MYDFETHPHIQPEPAPWTLHGNGYILLFRFSRAFLEQHAPRFPDHTGRLGLRIGCVILVDYTASNAGPYRELLLIPGLFHYGRRRHPTISNIYVSTWDSIVNGHVNWGIPKVHADFHIEAEADGSRRVQVSRENKPFVSLHLRSRGPRIPVHTALAPKGLRTVVQPYRGRFYRTCLSGSGRIQPTRLLAAEVDDALFPDFTDSKLLAAVRVTDFTLRFPMPHVEDIVD
ncbi:MAG: acetoacetate decarboxylase family protein [Acidobacteriota bacterium]|nr:acetoacetate decarboxylase family protein [Acidobacteriota bacterium]